MGNRVTMRDVAKAAGVSPMTVSRALKSDGTVNAKTREAVRAAAARLGYVYDATAQNFRAQRSGFLALTLPSINNANFATTHRALTTALAGTDLQMLLGITNYDLREEERLVRELLARRPEAIILTGGTHTEATRQLLATVSAPVFEIWDLPKAPIGHVIGFSNFDAMELIVAHLVSVGCLRLGFVGADGQTDVRGNERRMGVIAAARKRGLPPVVNIETGPAPATMSSTAAAVARQGARVQGLDALICVSDPAGFGALMAAQTMGLRVPEDLLITGFGNFEISQMSQPGLTTLDVSAAEIGTLTGTAAKEVLAPTGASAALTRRSIAPRLITRDSTLRQG